MKTVNSYNYIKTKSNAVVIQIYIFLQQSTIEILEYLHFISLLSKEKQTEYTGTFTEKPVLLLLIISEMKSII